MPREYTVRRVAEAETSLSQAGFGDDISTEEVALNTGAADQNHIDPNPDNDAAKQNLFLYEEDMKQMPLVASFIRNLQGFGQHSTYPSEKDVQDSKKQKAKLGMILGVYLPTIQHIFGVLMFVRLSWMVGSMGVIQSFSMVFMCCLTTFVTSISMSAIATNGAVQAGGSYFMISRNLGPECGAAVGICFFLANTFATDLYLLGSLEILLKYMFPQLAYFGDIHHNPWNNFRLYGTILVVLLTIVVAVGVKFVAYFAPFALICVIVSIACCFIGAFQANESNRDVWLCLLGNRLLAPPTDWVGNGTQMGTMAYIATWCNGNLTGDIWHRYCSSANGTENCDVYFQQHSPPTYRPGIPGITSSAFVDNAFAYYLAEGEVTPGVQGDPTDRGEVVQDYTTTFVALCAIYFPSVTGIMTGSNMSGDLRDPQKSIPVGTIAAQLTTSFVYLSLTLLYGATGEGVLLRDKYGASQGGALYAAKMAWPHEWVVLIGAFCSTLGAALQCITSAPRLLQAIARDDIIPFLNVFKVTRKNGEPLRALLLTALIAECGILIAMLDYVAPIIDVCFLMCYGFVNLAVALQTLLKAPSWRPRFRYYHWTLALLGVVLNLALSIIAGWYYALSAFLLAAFIYKYVQYKGSQKAWGDGIRGLSMSAAQEALLRLEEGNVHTKNWRPQILVLMKLQDDLQPKYPRLLSFSRQLKAGKGLTVVGAIINGNYLENHTQADAAKEKMVELLKKEKVKGFSKVMVTKDLVEGINVLIQTVGLGGMEHNTVVVGWPQGWKEDHTHLKWKVFLDTIRVVAAKELALLVPQGINNFPSSQERLTGTIDVWWIIHDGGMLILLSFLLRQHKTWRNCKVRIFTVAQMTDNSIQLKKDLEQFLYQLRITAEVYVEEMYDSDISAYTVERTLDMERRNQLLKQMKLKRAAEKNEKSHHGSRGHPKVKEGETDEELKIQENMSDNSNPNLTVLDAGDKKATFTLDVEEDPQVHFTFTAAAEKKSLFLGAAKNDTEGLQICEGKLMRMHTAIKLNEKIRNRSSEAQLVILNFPAPPPSTKVDGEENYMYYLEALTDGIDRVLMVRGTGREVVTIYS